MILAYKKTLGKFTKVLGFEKTLPRVSLHHANAIHHHKIKTHSHTRAVHKKLANLEARLVQNYDPLT